jgi:hypothetical protein
MAQMKRLVIPFLLVLSFSASCYARIYQYQLNCDLGKGAAQSTEVGGFKLVLAPENQLCRITVVGPNKETVFEHTSGVMQVFTGRDFTGDGEPDVLVQADGSPYRLFVVSLGSRPGLAKTIQNNYGFWLQSDCDDQRVRIWTADGAFQGDKELANIVYHYDLIVPEVVFEIEKTKLVDATPKCQHYFDRQIRLVETSLKPNDISRFRDGQITDKFHRGEVEGKVFKIVFSYLYSGREAKAKESLFSMWPRSDSQRIWEWIMQKRSEGVLQQTVPSG